MATASLPSATLDRRFPLTAPQSVWLLLQFAMLLVLFGWQYFLNHERFALLRQDPLGVRMGLMAVALAALHFLVLTSGYVLFNSRLQGRDQSRTVLTMLLSVACFLLLYLPVVFVLVIGPAAVSIQNNLLAR